MLKILLALVLLIAAILIYFGLHNGRIMNETLDEGLEILKQSYTVTEVPENEYQQIKLYGIMKFKTKQYDVEGLGNLCVMTTNMGMMQMATFLITPYEKQMPMMSTDFIYTFGSRKGYVECFNLVADPDSAEYQGVVAALQAAMDPYTDLTDVEQTPVWYDSIRPVSIHKQGKSAQDARFRQMFTDAVQTYVNQSVAQETLSAGGQAAQVQVVQDYCSSMIEKGGVSTEMFKKALGADVTLDFFEKVFYGPARYVK